MWKHRAYAKALIRQETVQLKHSEQLVLLLIADHCNETTNETSMSYRRIADLTQSATETIRVACKKLVKLNVFSQRLATGKAPVYHMPIPKDFTAASDTSLETGRAGLLSAAERQEATMEAALTLTGMTAEQMAMCVFQGVEGLEPEEAQALAAKKFEGKKNPAQVLLSEIKLSMASPAKTPEILDTMDPAAAEIARLDAEFEAPRAGESQGAYNHRVNKGRLRWNQEQEAMRNAHHNPQGR